MPTLQREARDSIAYTSSLHAPNPAQSLAMNVMNHERTALINTSNELECNLEIASASQQQVMVAIPSPIFCSVEVSNWHLASNIIAGISEVLLGKADENLFSDTQELSYKCRDTPALAFVGCRTIIQTKRPRSPWKCGICTLSKGEHGDSDYGWMVFGLFRLGKRSDRRGRDKFPMLKGFKPTPLSATDVNQAQLLAGFLGIGCSVQNENSRFVCVGNQGL
ncbi:hypothetical protein POTOM_009741 [Populus tomentosa]|uniref:Uncharacterized protein n=1 Tax=Populus tomentosa TaxID=118781 RepID=A0A8X8A762_POPTO|nr:hypothetical protein POTOM_009741 [Populus tomentosa]